MDSSLQKNQIEAHLDDSSSDNDSDQEASKYKSSSKVNKNHSQTKKQDGFQSRKRKADSVDESKPAKIGRNTPSKTNAENVCGLSIPFSPGERSSPRNTRRQIFESPNKLVVPESPVKLSAKKNLFESDACKLETNGRSKPTQTPVSEDQISSDDSEDNFTSIVKSDKSKFTKTYSRLKKSGSDLYALKSPSKTSPLKIRLVKDSPLRRAKTCVNSPTKNSRVSSPILKKTNNDEVATESDCETDQSRTPRKSHSSGKGIQLWRSVPKELNQLYIDMKERVTSPRKAKHATTPSKSFVEDSINKQFCQNGDTSPTKSSNSAKGEMSAKKDNSQASKKVDSESDSEQLENNKTFTPRQTHKKNKPLISTTELMRLNIDMNECVTSPRTSKRMITPRKSYLDEEVISSEKPVKQKSTSKEGRVRNQGILSKVESARSEEIKLLLDKAKVEINTGVSTPRKARRSSVSFSPLPPKHRPARTPRKDYQELSEEESPQKKSNSKTQHRRSLKYLKENIPENSDYVTPTKQSGSKSTRSCLSACKDDEETDNKDQCSTPLQRKSLSVTTPVSKKGTGRGFLTPSMARKESSSQTRTEDELDATRRQLHISTIPKSLPCRGSEFSQIKSFLARKIEHLSGGCMYISGVPGTGKTATVHAVVRSLQEDVDNGDLSEFDFVEVNGLRLTEPKQAYVRIYQALTDKKLTPDQAQQLLSRKFSGNCKKSTIVLVDELDYLCNRRQDVVYNILDWPTKRNSALVVLTISNTMDLAERTLKGRVTSRMGLTRVTFQPYSHHQLQEIVLDRLCGSEAFHPDAVQLVARKVAAVSGDARRALDICRRTTELVSSGEQVTAGHVQQALMQIFSGPRVLVIQQLSELSQLVLRSLRDVCHATGIEESTVAQLYKHLEQISVLENVPLPTVGAVLQTCVSLVNIGLIIAEKGRNDINRKLSLNVSSDDIHYALDNVRSL